VLKTFSEIFVSCYWPHTVDVVGHQVMFLEGILMYDFKVIQTEELNETKLCKVM
jgi:hypothetical protein